MKIGYARVSSNTQDLDLQIQELKKSGCKKIYSESISGKNNDRPELLAMIESLREKDTVVVYKIDRMARSLKGLISIVELLDEKKADLISLDSGDKVDTTSPMGRAFFQIAGVFAELERGMINARTKAGIQKARADGVKFGRVAGSQNKSTIKNQENIKIYLQAGKSYDWIVSQLSISKNTIAKVKKQLDAENGLMSVGGSIVPVKSNKIDKYAIGIDDDTPKKITLKMHLVVENNSKFVRGKGQSLKKIELLIQTSYETKIIDRERGDYEISIPYTTHKNLDEKIDEIVYESNRIADIRNGFAEIDVYTKEGHGWPFSKDYYEK